MRSPWQKFSRGFTLVELLVVITIIGLLAALIVPAIQGAIERARQNTCMNNLSQVGKASITGIRVLQHVRRVRNSDVTFWPFQRPDRSTIAEIYPTLFRMCATNKLAKLRSLEDLNESLGVFDSDRMPLSGRRISDHETDALISAAGLRCLARKPATWAHPDLTSLQVQREGWIFGVTA